MGGWIDGWMDLGRVAASSVGVHCQDHYTAMQPGLQRMVLRLEELVQRIDGEWTERVLQYPTTAPSLSLSFPCLFFQRIG